MKIYNEAEIKKVKGSVNVGVDKDGNVWNLKTKRIMKPYINVGNGYCYVHVLYEGNEKPTAKSVHRLVLETFVGLPEDKSKCQCGHIDDCRTNNRLDNLKWMTPTENARWNGRLERIAAARKARKEAKEKEQEG